MIIICANSGESCKLQSIHGLDRIQESTPVYKRKWVILYMNLTSCIQFLLSKTHQNCQENHDICCVVISKVIFKIFLFVSCINNKTKCYELFYTKFTSMYQKLCRSIKLIADVHVRLWNTVLIRWGFQMLSSGLKKLGYIKLVINVHYVLQEYMSVNSALLINTN